MALRAEPAMRSRAALPWILIGALLLRLAFVLWYPQMPIQDDAASYDQEARYLAFGERAVGHAVEIMKGPIYPGFLAAVYRVAGSNQAAIRVAQAVISVLSIALLYAVGLRVFGPQAAMIASLLAALYPPFISYTGWLLTETLSVFFVLAFVYSLLRAFGRPASGWWWLAGLIGGVLILHREEMLVIVASCAVALLRWRTERLGVAALCLAAALTVAPWTARNAHHFRRFVLVSPTGGEQLWISTIAAGGVEWDERAPHVQEYHALVDGLTPAQADQRLRRAALQNVLHRPIGYLMLCLQRVPKLWLGGHSNTFVGLEDSLASYLSRGAYVQVAIKLAMLLFNLGLTGLGFIGLFLAWKLQTADLRCLAVLAVPVLAKTLLHVVAFSTLRYQVPIMPLLIIFAACTIQHVRGLIMEAIPAHA